VPAGTLAANLIGGYLIGVAIAYLAHHPSVSDSARLFVITGFLGGLTTFSTFSAEVVSMLHQGRIGMALLTSGMHLGGSLLATAAGLLSAGALQRTGSG
jgi:CrcB protein